MSDDIYRELIRWVATRTDDPIINERKRRAVRVLLDMTPEVRDEVRKEARDEGRKEGRDEGRKEGRDEVRMEYARVMLRRALANRHLVLTAHDEARIDACTDYATLERWHEQAMDAASIADALR